MAIRPIPLRACIVGTGVQAHYLAREAFGSSPDASLVAGCDLSRRAAQAFGMQFGTGAATSPAEVEKNFGPIDIWYVCTPPATHLRCVQDILDATTGVIGIMCEKPPALKLEDARLMQRLVQERGAVLTYGLDRRPSAVQWLSRLERQGLFGTIYNARASWMMNDCVPDRGGFLSKDRSVGGPGMDLLPHLLDLAMVLFAGNRIVSATARTHRHMAEHGGSRGLIDPATFEVEDMMTGRFELAHSGRSTPPTIDWTVAWDAHVRQPHMWVEWFGTDGSATLELVQEPGDRHLFVPSAVVTMAGQRVTLTLTDHAEIPTLQQCRARLLTDLVETVRERRAGSRNREPLVSPEEANGVLGAILAAYRSADSDGAGAVV